MTPHIQPSFGPRSGASSMRIPSPILRSHAKTDEAPRSFWTPWRCSPSSSQRPTPSGLPLVSTHSFSPRSILERLCADLQYPDPDTRLTASRAIAHLVKDHADNSRFIFLALQPLAEVMTRCADVQVQCDACCALAHVKMHNAIMRSNCMPALFATLHAHSDHSEIQRYGSQVIVSLCSDEKWRARLLLDNPTDLFRTAMSRFPDDLGLFDFSSSFLFALPFSIRSTRSAFMCSDSLRCFPDDLGLFDLSSSFLFVLPPFNTFYPLTVFMCSDSLRCFPDDLGLFDFTSSFPFSNLFFYLLSAYLFSCVLIHSCFVQVRRTTGPH